uniref:Uncharacterized protein n=1 Tax=Desulfovibrio sp. U5L TaxID=596152 RepID=I2Q6I5_9BACT
MCSTKEKSGVEWLHRIWQNFRSNYPWRTWYIFLILFATALAIAIMGSAKAQPSDNSDYWLYTILASLVVNALATYIVLFLGLPHFQKYLKHLAAKKRGKEIVKFWDLQNSLIKKITIYYGGKLGTWRDGEGRTSSTHYSSLPTIYSIQRLKERIGFYFGDRYTVESKQFPVDNHFTDDDNDSHVIILGGYLSIPILKQFSENTGFMHSQNFEDRSKRITKIGQKDFPTNVINGEPITSDYALLTVAVEKKTQKCLYWFSGNCGFGTFGAVLAATEESNRCNLLLPKPGSYTQCLIETKDIANEEMFLNHNSFDASFHINTKLPEDFTLEKLWASTPHPTQPLEDKDEQKD